MTTIKLQIVFNTRAIEIYRRDENNKVVDSQSFAPAGVELCQLVMEHLKTQHQFLIARLSAEKIILSVGRAFPTEVGHSIQQMGRNTQTGLPQRREITTKMIDEPLDQFLGELVAHVAWQIYGDMKLLTVEDTLDNTIILGGEYSRLRGVDKLFQEKIRQDAMPEANIVLKKETL